METQYIHHIAIRGGSPESSIITMILTNYKKHIDFFFFFCQKAFCMLYYLDARPTFTMLLNVNVSSWVRLCKTNKKTLIFREIHNVIQEKIRRSCVNTLCSLVDESFPYSFFIFQIFFTKHIIIYISTKKVKTFFPPTTKMSLFFF